MPAFGLAVKSTDRESYPSGEQCASVRYRLNGRDGAGTGLARFLGTPLARIAQCPLRGYKRV
jgi:hypothetical protein